MFDDVLVHFISLEGYRSGTQGLSQPSFKAVNKTSPDSRLKKLLFIFIIKVITAFRISHGLHYSVVSAHPPFINGK